MRLPSLTDNQVIFAIFGLIWMVYALIWMWWVRRTKQWIPVDAVLTRAEARRQMTVINGARGSEFLPTIEYRYTVDGGTYTSRRFSTFNFTMGMSANDVNCITGWRGAGSTIKVYRSPVKASRSIIVMPNPSVAWIVGTIGIFIFVGTVWGGFPDGVNLL